jgi:hypothetical protein
MAAGGASRGPWGRSARSRPSQSWYGTGSTVWVDPPGRREDFEQLSG